MSETVRLVLDSWRYVESVRERALRGAYVRCFLVFTDRRVVEFKTSHYSESSLPWGAGTLHETFGRGDLLSHLFWGPIFYLIREKLVKKRLEREIRLFRDKTRGLLGKSSLEEAARVLDEIKGSLGIRKVEESASYPLPDIKKMTVSGGRIAVQLKEGREITYHLPPGAGETGEIKKLLAEAGYPVD
jgi:hypothetical protein